MAVDIHHVFPHKWCLDNGIDDERPREHRQQDPARGRHQQDHRRGRATDYLKVIEKKAGIDAGRLDDVLSTHLVDAEALRSSDFDLHFNRRREALVQLVERAIGKTVQRDVDQGAPEESLDQFETTNTAVAEDEEP